MGLLVCILNRVARKPEDPQLKKYRLDCRGGRLVPERSMRQLRVHSVLSLLERLRCDARLRESECPPLRLRRAERAMLQNQRC